MFTTYEPAHEETEVALAPTISWDPIEKTEGYRLSLGTSPGASDILEETDLGTATSYIPNGDLPFGTEIFVRIRPYNSAGTATDCAIQSFTTMIPEDGTKYGFSPDGDGVNEYWHIENIDYYPDNKVTIYNRWGNMVFMVEGYNNQDKAFNGAANQMLGLGAGVLPEGTYFFHIEVPKENILNKTKGYLVLKR